MFCKFKSVVVSSCHVFEGAHLLICHRNSANSISAKENAQKIFIVNADSYHLGEGTYNSRVKLTKHGLWVFELTKRQ